MKTKNTIAILTAIVAYPGIQTYATEKTQLITEVEETITMRQGTLHPVNQQISVSNILPPTRQPQDSKDSGKNKTPIEKHRVSPLPTKPTPNQGIQTHSQNS
jgi:hypothetical protein